MNSPNCAPVPPLSDASDATPPPATVDELLEGLPYRAPSPPSTAPLGDTEFSYVPGAYRHGKVARVVFRYVVILGLAAFQAMAHWGLAVATLLIVGARDVYGWRHRRQRGVRLHLEHDELVVYASGSRRAWIRIPLWQLADVTLDTRTATKAAKRVRPDGVLDWSDSLVVDESRILLVAQGGAQIPLTESYYSGSETLDYLGKLRLFLRRNGWTPEEPLRQSFRAAAASQRECEEQGGDR